MDLMNDENQPAHTVDPGELPEPGGFGHAAAKSAQFSHRPGCYLMKDQPAE